MGDTLFPSSFAWGVATSALQIEGSMKLDGRGESVWDERYLSAGTGDDDYARMEEDVLLLKKLGVKAYRFSLSWSRIIPEGKGRVNQNGLEHYSRLVDLLLQNGIEPYITIFHWDYPSALEKEGGWLNEKSPLWLKEYAKVVGEFFSGRVRYYIIYNEPQCFLNFGYFTKEWPPFHEYKGDLRLKINNNLLLAGKLAAEELRKTSAKPLSIGLAMTFSPAYPLDPNNPSDVEAARTASFSKDFSNNLFNLPFYTDPAYLGAYDESWLKYFGVEHTPAKEEAMNLKGDYDFLGINLYSSFAVSCVHGRPALVETTTEYPNSLKWNLHKEVLGYPLKFLYERYGKPIFVTENGIAGNDVLVDGEVHDHDRVGLMEGMLRNLSFAINELKVPVEGYFHWSLIDNFEWMSGYEPRFGLVYVDYANNAKRIEKDSFSYYRDIIISNGKILRK